MPKVRLETFLNCATVSVAAAFEIGITVSEKKELTLSCQLRALLRIDGKLLLDALNNVSFLAENDNDSLKLFGDFLRGNLGMTLL